jgi:nitrate reductase NapE component
MAKHNDSRSEETPSEIKVFLQVVFNLIITVSCLCLVGSLLYWMAINMSEVQIVWSVFSVAVIAVWAIFSFFLKNMG